jgi:micrococcal nuclease
MQSGSSLGLYTVSKVIDGDTFSVTGGERVRMMGINTPEVDQYFYEEAKEVLSLMIDKTGVCLERDISDTDKYGRLLRYVFVGELFVNLEMVKRGFANVFTVPPDIKYTDELLEAERYARENNLGLWEISAGYIGENIKEDEENKAGSSTGQSGTELKTISVELVWDAPGNDMENLNGEYACIKNESAYDIDIGGWTVKDSATKIYEFKHYILKSGEKIFLFSGSGADSGGRFYWNNSQPVWNNDHDTLYLRDSAGLLVEIYNY